MRLPAPLLKPVRSTALLKAVLNALEREDEIGDAAVAVPGVSLPPTPPTAEEAMAAGRLILVAEDNAINRRVVSSQLSRLGHAFEIADDGRAAWELLLARRYGMLLSDCLMPEMDGYELTRRIRQREAEEGLPRLPVIALTANVIESEMQKCWDAGMDGFLSKPVDLDLLAATLEKWLPPLSRPEDSEPPLDLRRFAEIIGCDEIERIREILAYFGETFEDNLETLRQAAAGDDREAIRQAAHAAKGAARNACAPVLSARLEELESAARTDEPLAGLRERVGPVEAAYREVRTFISGL